MLNAVWVAVIVAAAFWVVGVCAAVYVMAKAARLMSQTTDAVAGLRERQESLIERAGTTIDRANEQLVKTDAITASMAEVTGRMTALAPLARVIAASAGSPAAKVAALAYGVNRALWMRRPASAQRGSRPPAARPAAARPPAPSVRALPRPAAPGWRRAALSGQRDEVAP